MRRLVLAMAMACAVCVGLVFSGGAQATPVGNTLGDAAQTLNVVEKSQFVYGGRRHCWYANGWHGPGWYWCGYGARRGLGWGGPVGWNGWAAPGVVVAAPGVAVGVGVGPRWWWNGRYWYNRRRCGPRWCYY